MRRLGSTLLLLVLWPAASVAAQAAPLADPLPAGAVVRLTWRGTAPIRARLLAPLPPTSAVVVYCRYPAPDCAGPSPRDTVQQPTAGLERVELRRGTQVRRGAVIGALAGAAGALVVLVGTAEQRRAGESGRAVALVIGTGLLWGGFGALIGSGHDRWAAATP